MSGYTVPEMRAIAVEAVDVYYKLPDRILPKLPGNNWTEYQAEPGDRSTDNKITVLPSADAISRADAFWDIFCGLLTDKERLTIREWLVMKTSKDATIRQLCKENEEKEHQYRRRIDKIFQKLAENYRVKGAVRQKASVEHHEKPVHKQENRRALTKYPNHWNDGKPVEATPEQIQSERNKLITRLVEGNRLREKQRNGA